MATLAEEATLLPAVMGDDSDPLTLLDLSTTQATAAVDTSISGVAVAPDPLLPIAGQVVNAINRDTGDSYSTYTLNDGSFVFPQVTPGTYALVYEGAIITSSSTVTVADGQAVQGVTLDLISGATLTGETSGLQDGAPIPNATIQVIDGPGDSFTATSDADGQYVFHGLPDGTYTLIADASDFARTFLDGIMVSSGTQGINLSMSPESVLTGTVSPAVPAAPPVVICRSRHSPTV